MTDLELRNLMERLEALTARLEGLTAGSGGDAGSAGRAGGSSGGRGAGGAGGPGRFMDGYGTNTDGHEASAGGVAPREAAYREALNETVAVLEATRSSFRSRQLKELRERIEFVLRN